MPAYDFVCTDCGPFEQIHAMREVPDAAVCRCGGRARRSFSAPMIGRGQTTAMRLQEATRATAHEPRVVSATAPGARRPVPVSADPRHARLPRL